MAGDTVITVIGNLTADPNFASSLRSLDRQSGEWSDGPALFLRCTLWRQPAENAADLTDPGRLGARRGRGRVAQRGADLVDLDLEHGALLPSRIPSWR